MIQRLPVRYRSAPDDVEATDQRDARHPQALQIAFGIVLFALAVGLPLLRQSGTHSWQTVWAEDGTIYFRQAHSDGGIAVLFHGYAGYLQLPPRILGAVSALVPVRGLALYFALSAELVNAALAWFVYWASEGWITSRVARLALASLFVLMPVLGHENTATITNTIWTFAAVAPWALISLKEGRTAVAVRGLVAFLAATSTALTLLFLPLAIVYGLVRKTRANWLVIISFGVGAIAQLSVTAYSPYSQTAYRQASRLPELISVRVFCQYLLADRGINGVWTHRAVLVVLAPLLILTILVALARRARVGNRMLAATFLVYSVVLFVVPVWARGTFSAAFTSVLPPSRDYIEANRFSVVPVLLLAGAIALVLDGSRRPPWVARVLPLVFAAHIAVLTTLGFSVTNQRSPQPSWSSNIDGVYRRQCVGAAPSKEVAITEVISFVGGGFVLHVSCREIER